MGSWRLYGKIGQWLKGWIESVIIPVGDQAKSCLIRRYIFVEFVEFVTPGECDRGCYTCR